MKDRVSLEVDPIILVPVEMWGPAQLGTLTINNHPPGYRGRQKIP